MLTRKPAFDIRSIFNLYKNWNFVLYIGLIIIMTTGQLTHLEAASIRNQTDDDQFLTRRIVFQNFFVEVGIQVSCYGSCEEDSKGAPKDPICEGDIIRLNCAKPYVIKIQSAECGRLQAGKDLCKLRDIFGSSNKGQRDSTVTVANMCEAKTQCEMNVDEPHFHEECTGEYNYLDVKFLCVMAPTTTIKTTTIQTTTTSPTTIQTTKQTTTNIFTTIRTIFTTTKNEIKSTNSTTLIPLDSTTAKSNNKENRSLFWFLSAFAMLSDGQFIKANVTHMSLTILLSVFIGFIISLCLILDHCRRRRGSYTKPEDDESDLAATEDGSCSSKCYLLDEHELQEITSQKVYCNGSHHGSIHSRGNGVMENGKEPIPRRSLLRMKTDSYYSQSDTIEPSSDFPEPPQEFLTDISSSDQRQSLISGTEEDGSTISNPRYLQSDQSDESLSLRCDRADHISTGHSCYRDIQRNSKDQNKAMILFNNELVSMTTKRQHEQRLCAMHAGKLKTRDSPDCYPVDDRPAKAHENPQQSLIKMEEANKMMLNLQNNKVLCNGHHTIPYDSSITNDKHITFGPIVDSDGLMVNIAVNEQDRGKLKMILPPTTRRSCLRQSSLTKEDNQHYVKARPKSLYELPNEPTTYHCHEHHHGYGSKPNQLNKFKNGDTDPNEKSCQCQNKAPLGPGEPYGPKRSTLKRTKTLPASSTKTWRPVVRKPEVYCEHHAHESPKQNTPKREHEKTRPVTTGSSLPRRQNSIPRDRNRKLISPVKNNTGHVSRDQPLNTTPKNSPANSLNREKMRTFPREHKSKWVQRVDGSSDEEAAVSPTSITDNTISMPRSNSLNRKVMNGSAKHTPTKPPNVALRPQTKVPPPVRPKSGKLQIQLRQTKDVDEHVSATSL